MPGRRRPRQRAQPSATNADQRTRPAAADGGNAVFDLGVPNNLPASLTSFVGRRQETEHTARLLGESRLVTVAGAPGLGKTRLALRIATACASDYQHGAWLVELAPLSDASLIPQTAASALGLRHESAHDLEALVAHLRRRRALLVLDNCEHLLAPTAALVEHLLRACPGLSVLATSREPFAMLGEAVVKLDPLPLPAPGEGGPAEVARYESVQLFAVRAAATRPDFKLDGSNAATVADICRRLEGIPLAIELAAARMEALSPSEIVWRLGDRFRFLRRGNRTALPRHQTLQAALDWSHELLTGPEQALLRRLWVFPGDFSADAAERVCSGASVAAGDVFAVLEQLVAKSLVVAEITSSGARFRMLDTVRAYARTRLDAAQEAALREAHIHWSLEMAESAESHLSGVDEEVWLERLEAEHDNLRAALEWAVVEHTAPDDALRLCGALAMFWRLRGHWREGQEWLQRALDAAPGAAAVLRAKALWGLGLLAWPMADFRVATAVSEESLALYREAKDAAGTALALNLNAAVLLSQHPMKSLSLLEESTVLARRRGHGWALTESLSLTGQAYMLTGRPAEAVPVFEEARSLAGGANNYRALAGVLIWLGWARSLTGDKSANDLYEEGLSLARRFGGPYDLAEALIFLGSQLESQGDRARASELLQECRLLGANIGSPLLAVRALRGLATVALDEGNVDDSEPLFDQAITIAREAQLGFVLVRCLLGRTEISMRRSDAEGARRFALEALEMARANDDRQGIVQALTVLGYLARSEGDDDRAAGFHHEVLVLSEGLGPLWAAASLAGLAGLAAAHKRYAAAGRLFGAAHAAGRGATPLSPQQRADFALAKKEFGAEQFEEHFYEGTRMTLEEAVDYANRGRGRKDRPSAGWESLTKAERQVVALVAEGLTNREIGDRLFISRFTAASHLSHVFTKLGLSSRRELAKEAARRGLE